MPKSGHILWINSNVQKPENMVLLQITMSTLNILFLYYGHNYNILLTYRILLYCFFIVAFHFSIDSDSRFPAERNKIRGIPQHSLLGWWHRFFTRITITHLQEKNNIFRSFIVSLLPMRLSWHNMQFSYLTQYDQKQEFLVIENLFCF